MADDCSIVGIRRGMNIRLGASSGPAAVNMSFYII